MKLRLSILTMLIAGSLLSAPSTRSGQIPLKNAPLERETAENLNMKRYVAAGDRAYIVGVQNGSLVPDVSLNPDGIGWHITGQMGLTRLTRHDLVENAALRIDKRGT